MHIVFQQARKRQEDYCVFFPNDPSEGPPTPRPSAKEFWQIYDARLATPEAQALRKQPGMCQAEMVWLSAMIEKHPCD